MTVTVEFSSVDTAFPSAGTRAARPVAPRRPAVPVRRVRGRVVSGTSSCVAAAPQPMSASSAVQLTRRGWVVLLSVAVAVTAVLVWVAFLSHPATPSGSSAPSGVAAPSQVVVQPGDTLWSIATRVAPDRDPRAVVYDLQQANHLADSTVVEGQVLRLG